LSHSKSEIVFKEEQKILFDGKSGSGKSSLVEAILFALYGNGRCDNNMSLIKRGKEKATVVVELVDKENKKEYRIERSITKKNKHELDVLENGVPVKVKGIRESQDHIEKNILHASYLLFLNSILYKQDNQDTFVNQTAQKRKDLIMELVGSATYDDYLKKTKEEISKLKTKQEVVLAKIESKQNDIESNKAMASTLSHCEDEEKRLKKEIEELKKEYEGLMAKEKQISESLLSIKNEEEKLKEKLKEVDAKNQKEKELNQKIIDLTSVDIEIVKKELAGLNEVKIKVKGYDDAKDKLMAWSSQRMVIVNETPAKHDYQSEIDAVNRQLIDLIGDTAGQCPKCGYIDPERDLKKKDGITIMGAKLNGLNSDFEAYLRAVKACSDKLEALGVQPELPMLPDEYGKLKEKLNGVDELNKKIINAENTEKQKTEATAELALVKSSQTVLNEEIIKLTESINKNVSLHEEQRQVKDDIIKINGKLDTLMASHNSNNQLLGMASYATKLIEQSKIDLEVLKKDTEKDIESLESLELLKDAFGPNGIKAMVVDFIIPQLEDRINNILGKLSDMRVRLETQKSGVSEETVLEGLFIMIINGENEEMEYNNFSGGEKIKVSVAINEALAEVSKIGFRILDETIVALDGDSVQNFIVAMEEILLKVGQVIMISHITELKALFDEKITVTKVNGDSKINV
jgi:exonuclease SbcC